MASIRLRIRQYEKIAHTKGWRTDAMAGAAIGVDAASVWRIRKGKSGPGEKFIAGLLIAAAPFEFGDLFEVVADTDEDAA